MAIEQRHKQHGEEGTAADDERRVGGGGVEHRRILGQEIDGAAGDAEHYHQQLVAPGLAE